MEGETTTKPKARTSASQAPSTDADGPSQQVRPAEATGMETKSPADAGHPHGEAGEAATGPARKLVLHYHLFKNAGTSVDFVLKANFGEAWHEVEFPARSGGRLGNAGLVADWIARHPEAKVLSSHTALLPLPCVAGVDILPVLFLRHPLVRLKSAYSFERHQKIDSPMTRLARSTDLAGYLRARLARPNDRSCRNFQTFRLALAVPEGEGSELDRALSALDILPFIGIVEQFGPSMERLAQWLDQHFPGFSARPVRMNVTSTPEVSVAERVEQIRHELGEALFDEVRDANHDDLRLYEAAAARTPA